MSEQVSPSAPHDGECHHFSLREAWLPDCRDSLALSSIRDCVKSGLKLPYKDI
jgi:hypothetical protein